VFKNEQNLNVDYNFDHQMYLSKSKCLFSNNCLRFSKHAVPLILRKVNLQALNFKQSKLTKIYF